MSKVASTIICVINGPIGSNRKAARTRIARWQRVLPNRHGVRVDAGQFVAAELAKDGLAAARDHDSVGNGVARGYLFQIDFPGLRIEPSNKISLLYREPKLAVGGKDWGVRALRPWIWHAEPLHLPSFRVQFADVVRIVCGEPNVAAVIGRQSVRS